jgi:type IV pilus assembly protein PilV
MTTFNSFPVAMRGTTMLEVLITIVILAFGLLGVVGLQSKMQIGEMESYQRAQAILLLQDMVDRINANRANAANYVSATVFGTGQSPAPASPCPTAAGVSRDQCEWSYALLGAAEKRSTTNLGAMIGARGCVELVQAANPAAGVCTPGIYLVSVAWQGFSATNTTVAPAQTCGTGQYSDDKLRRVIAARVMVGLPECS